ncbi:MAG TPA: hypothetical protein PKE51_10400, partial [Gemmatimonadaceae bacterium]|nr:hypothetical protein [Gemmatimonadaceae bacterium]
MTPLDPTPPPSGRARDDARDEHITATGWRVKGAAIPLVEEAARLVPLAAARPADGLVAVKVRLRPRLTRDRVVPIVLPAITEAVRVHWPDAPPLLDDAPLSRPAERLHALRWEVRGGAGAWTGELRWRHPHPTVRNVACLTHVVLQEHAGLVTLAVRVSAEGGLSAVRGAVGAGQAMPAFLRSLRHRVRITIDEYDTAPHVLDEAHIDAFVREVLLGERRAVPVFVLAPQEGGDYLVEPELLADELAGLGPLYVLARHATTFRLTDSLGDRRLSCFFGALRVYLPGFTCADEPTHHPLMLRDRLVDPIERLALVGQLAQRAARESTLPAGVMDDAEVTPARAFAAPYMQCVRLRNPSGAPKSAATGPRLHECAKMSTSP